MDRRVDITNVEAAVDVQFSYSVEWYEEPNLPWKYRLTRYTDSRFVPSSFEIRCYRLSLQNFWILLVASMLIKQLRGVKHEQSQSIEIGEAKTEQIRLSKLANTWLVKNNVRPTECNTEPLLDAEEVR
jgi:hypothetical protein